MDIKQPLVPNTDPTYICLTSLSSHKVGVEKLQNEYFITLTQDVLDVTAFSLPFVPLKQGISLSLHSIQASQKLFTILTDIQTMTKHMAKS